MSKFKKAVGKAWVFGAAAAVIVGSGSTMAIALGQNATAYAATTAHIATKQVQTLPSPQMSNLPQSSGGYTVVDESKHLPSQPSAMLLAKFKLEDSAKGITATQQQLQQQYSEWTASNTPGAKDMSAQQAAAYAAPYVEQAYGLDLKGYTAKTEFMALPTPNSAQWVVTFYPPNEDKPIDGYSCTINSVTGEFIDLELSAGGGETSITNLTYPWLIPTAAHDISKLLPKNVSITSTKIVGHKAGAVYFVSNLSNGSAFGVALNETNKSAFWYHYFPSGYDGLWDGYNS
ncbi:hypothetical protein [Alicyclobacillus fodiniaquatilis]|uniref:Uncharacterized protein n=1 Tax=Alicyclobacillus fodiniaquatilis TaxID=1661150 RepID=A0ABW4JMX4_9BACL